MVNLSDKYIDLKKEYRTVFLSLLKEINYYLSEKTAKNIDGLLISEKKDDVKVVKDLILKLEIDIQKLKKECIEARKAAKCLGCGVCCRFAVSEFSIEELKQKATNNDEFATQFLSVFEPYSSKEAPSVIFGEYIEFLNKYTEGGYYIYHCPKVTTDNRCPDYENRPQICRDFPDNPIAFLPLSCGYNDWKNLTQKLFLKARASSEILEVLKSKI